MHIALTNVIQPSLAASITDVVPPTQLFTIARNRFVGALEMLEIDTGGFAPSVLDAQDATFGALSGVRLLRSTLVPSTPFHQRESATAAIDDINIAVRALTRYEGILRSVEAPKLATELPVEALTALDQARTRLAVAAGRLA